MSDSIPIIAYVFPKERLAEHFGDEVGALLQETSCNSDVASYQSPWNGIGEQERMLEARSRGGMLISALAGLIGKAKLDGLDFIANGTPTHEIVSTAYDMREKFQFHVVRDGFDAAMENIAALITWSRAHTDEIPEELLWDYGADRDGKRYETAIQVIDDVGPSLDPNREICDEESNSLALAFSVLKTIGELLAHARDTDSWVIVQHWDGIE